MVLVVGDVTRISIHYRVEHYHLFACDLWNTKRTQKVFLMKLRDKFAMHSPVTFDMVLKVWGDDNVNLVDDRIRLAFMTVWTLMNYEYADVMIWQREQK